MQYVHKNLQNSINVQDQVADEFEKMSFYSMEDCRKKCSRTKAFASLFIILLNRKGVHELKIKVDTGADGNTFPLRTFQQMFPEHVDRNGRLCPGTTQKDRNSICLQGWIEACEILPRDLQWTYHTRFILSSGLKTGYPTLFHSENKVCPSQSWDKYPSYSIRQYSNQLHERPDWSISGSIWSDW